MEEGKPTGIKRQDLSKKTVEFEGRRAVIVSYSSDFNSSHDLLKLGFGDSHLVLYGYFDGEEFMEIFRERLD